MTIDKIKVLYIDDEESNLMAFKAAFRRQFNVFLANSADKGLAILNDEQIEVIIADQRMPNKTGVEFFESILHIHQNPIRILLTGYADIDAVIAAINKGQVYRYVTKPWNELDLKNTIENAYQTYFLKEQNNKLNLKYQKVFSESLDAIILFDKKGRIIDYNKATLNLIDERSISDKYFTFRSFFKSNKTAKKIIDTVLEKNELQDFECEIITPNKVTKTCLISCNAITNNYGNIISHQAIIKDITTRHQLQQVILKNTLKTQEQERERIARDLHDGLGQSLAAIKLLVGSNSFKHKQQANIEDNLKHVSKLLDGAIDELRKICYHTLPIILQEYGLAKAIKELISNVSEKKCSINFTISNDFPTIENTLEIAIYRIVQEFISNSLKHSSATQIDIEIENDNYLNINLRDNGVGFDIKKIQKGHGLKNIQSRIETFKGSIDINTSKNNGVEFKIIFPLTNKI